MDSVFFNNYLIVINILGFILFAINTWLYSNTQKGQIDAILTITSLLGGSLGIVLAILIIDRKAEKGNMMSRVFVICVLIIQIVAFLLLRGHHQENITFAFWEYFGNYRIFIIYLLLINLITFIAYGVDKYSAVKHKHRIRIVALLGLAFIGGSVGGLLAMYIFRHKTKKDYFSVGLPLIIVMQIVLVFYLMNI